VGGIDVLARAEFLDDAAVAKEDDASGPGGDHRVVA
jgi:hypothetical protein